MAAPEPEARSTFGVERGDLQRLLALEAAVHRATAPREQTLDVSTYSLIALAELLTLRERWRAAGHSVNLKGASVRPLLQSVRAVVAGNNLRDSCLAACGCLKVPFTPDQSFQDSQQRFLLAASAALQRARFPTVARQRLLGAFGELIDNVFAHAGACRWSLAAYEMDSESQFTASVMDCGEGVLAGYMRSGMLGSESSAADALDLAVVQHRSSTGRSDRGLGFTQLMDALKSLDAYVRVRSDDASITLQSGAAISRVHPRLAEEFRLSGFVVSFRAWCSS